MSDFVIWILIAIAILVVAYFAAPRFRSTKLGRNIGKHVDKDGDGKFR